MRIISDDEYGVYVEHEGVEYHVHTEPSMAQKKRHQNEHGTDDPPPPWPWWVYPYGAHPCEQYKSKEEALKAIEQGKHK